MQQRTWELPEWRTLEGQFVTLSPLVPERDVEPLYAASHGTPAKETIWHYLPYGAFASALSMKEWLHQEMIAPADVLPYTVFAKAAETPVGVVALRALVPEYGCAEIGDVWFTPSVQRSKVNAESQYLLLRHLFDTHAYRRVTWECNALNHASRTTAARMGFRYEGRFRQHMWVKGKNRDTGWFAMTDKEWSRCKGNFEQWLYVDDTTSLTALNNG